MRVVDLASGGGEPVACSCGPGVPLVPGSPWEGATLAAWLRDRLGERAEVCVYADGRASFAREPGAPRTTVRLRS